MQRKANPAKGTVQRQPGQDGRHVGGMAMGDRRLAEDRMRGEVKVEPGCTDDALGGGEVRALRPSCVGCERGAGGTCPAGQF